MRFAAALSSFLCWAHRLSLRLYPAPVRRRDASDMQLCFEDLVDRAHRERGSRGLVVQGLRCLVAEPWGCGAAWRAVLLEYRQARRVRREATRGSTVMFDIKQSVRQLVRRPGVTLLIVLCLSVGVGATTVLLSGVDAVLWRSLAVPEPERLVRVFERDQYGVGQLSHGDFMTVEEESRDLLDGLAVQRLETFALQPTASSAGQNTRVLHGELVSASYFDLLRAPLALGHAFSTASSGAPESELAMVISHHLFENVFGADPSVLGRVVRLDDIPVEIVGVAAEEFQGTKFGLAMDVWVPVQPWAFHKGWDSQWASSRTSGSWYVIGRLADGVPFGRVQGNLDRISEELAQSHPQTHANRQLLLYDNRLGEATPQGGETASLISVLALAAGGLVLLVACSNVAALLLARGVARSPELGMRATLGAGRRRLVGQLMGESVLLALLGGLGGLGLSLLGPVLLMSWMPDLPYRMGLDFTPRPQILGLGLLVAVASALVFGLWPALRSTSARFLDIATRGASVPRATSRALDSVVVAMISLSFVTLVLAGLFASSLGAVSRVHPGFETEGRILAAFDTGLSGDSSLDPVTFYSDLARRAEALPLVRSVGVTSVVPLGDRGNSSTTFAEDRSYGPEDDGVPAWTASVSPGLLETIDMTLLRGRDFDLRDRADAPAVALINQTMAMRLFDTEDAVGRRFRYRREPDSTSVEVVGVVEDGRYRQLTEPTTAALFLPFEQSPTSYAYLVARAGSDDDLLRPERLATLAGELRRIGAETDARVPLFQLKTLDAWVHGSLWLFRMGASAGSMLGALALLLAVAGLHGVVSYSMTQRTFELGLRKALGAKTVEVVGLVMGRALRLGGAGIAVGALLSWAVGGALSGLLFGISPGDPRVFIAVAALVCLVAVIAGLRPAVGAARLDPAVTLRDQ